MWETLGRVMALALMLGLFTPSAGATTAEEKQQFTVTGVEVDETAADAAQARLKAIEQAQIKAFAELAKRLAGESGGAIMATLPPADVGRMMASLSVEDERSAPGRYIGKLTISFLPAKVREAFLAKGIDLAAGNDGILLIPVWVDGGAEPVIWDDNPWRRAVVGLNLPAGSVPFRLPLGDTQDWSAFSTPDQATPETIGPLLSRYKATKAVLMLAEQDQTGIRVRLVALPAQPTLSFEKTYPLSDISLTEAAAEAANALSQNWQGAGGATPETPPAGPLAALAGAPQALEATLMFTSPEQLAQIRQNLLTAAGVQGMDLVQIMVGGAIVRINHTGTMQELHLALGSRGLELVELSSGWTIRPY
jgi:hypothetical protein